MKAIKPKPKYMEQPVAIFLEKENWDKLKLIKKHLKLPYKHITRAALEQYLTETWPDFLEMIKEAKKEENK